LITCRFRPFSTLISPLALEFVTQGLARATSHRVLSPPKGSTPRYSVPFFQNISLNVRLADEVIQCAFLSWPRWRPRLRPLIDISVLTVPPEVLKLKEERGTTGATDCACAVKVQASYTVLNPSLKAVNFTEFDREPSGRVNLIGRVK
jgi:hypothetical protein